MSLEIGTVSYGAAAVAFGILSGLLLTSWRGRLQGALLVVATIITAVWAAVVAHQRGAGASYPTLMMVLEVARDAAWGAFLLRLLSPNSGQLRARGSGLRLTAVAFAVISAVLIVLTLAPSGGWVPPRMLNVDGRILGHVALAVLGLALVEQLYRNTRSDRRWAIKFLCFGVGGLFAYDFFLYSNGLLFKQVDAQLWDARGLVNALIVPLIAVSAARNPEWSLDVFVSRRIVFHTMGMLGAGIYLLAMAAGGYYLRLYGGSWGRVAQAIFLFGAAVLLVVMMSSGHLRARLKVFVSKHFFNYRYDYREEWLRLTGTLSKGGSELPLLERAIRAVADIVDSGGGGLWLLRGGGGYDPVARWNMSEISEEREPVNGAVASFLGQREWVVNLDEYDQRPDLYPGWESPAWLVALKRAWLVVPLLHHDRLLGFIVLARPRAPKMLNWEDSDLLKIAARQVASHVAQHEAAEALAAARQFEAFNRLSAFLVHDLKNVIAQLSLVGANAQRHKHNPAFVEDAFRTVDNAVQRINRTLSQLRSGQIEAHRATRVDLVDVLREVVATRAQDLPSPTLCSEVETLTIQADRERLLAIVGHVVQNAQEATPPDGRVEVWLQTADGQVVIEVRDSGCGMDAQFVRERLFRPFDTTKGRAGMGIGAYEAREAVRELGGEVQVESEPGRGTVFRISLRLVAPREQGGTITQGAVG